MGRSVHTTRGDLKREWRWGDGDREQRLEPVRSVGRRLGLKRRIKGQIREERRREFGPLDLPPLPPAGVPIRVIKGRYLLHAASEEDLREVMARLPGGALNGVSEVLLSSGRGEQGEEVSSDPFVGRAGFESLPGVWGGEILGVYQHRARRIQVFAYVFGGERLPQPAFSGLYLKLRALTTFVHEVAHHQDRSLRVARGRWRMDDSARNERYAEGREHRWVLDVVIPYLEDAYPRACAELERWLKRYTGLPLSLWDLAGDPRNTRRDGTSPATFDLRVACVRLVSSLEAGRSRRSARLEFAEDLLYTGRISMALEVIGGVLSESPEDVRARVLKADAFDFLERFDEAQELIERVLEEQPRNLDALRVLRLILAGRADWRRLALAVDLEIRLEGRERQRLHSLLYRARAALELADYQRLEELTRELRAGPIERLWRAGEALCLLGLLRQARFADASISLEEIRSAEHWRGWSSWRDEVALVRFAHERHLGRPAFRPGPSALERLRARGYGSWLQALLPQLPLAP